LGENTQDFKGVQAITRVSRIIILMLVSLVIWYYSYILFVWSGKNTKYSNNTIPKNSVHRKTWHVANWSNIW